MLLAQLGCQEGHWNGQPQGGGDWTRDIPCPLAWAPIPWLWPDTSFAHTAVMGRGPVGPEAAALSFYLAGHGPSFPDLFLPLHSQRL